MTNRPGTIPTITRRQGRQLDEKWAEFIDSLGEEQADWLLRNFNYIEHFVQRRPEDGMFTRPCGIWPIQDRAAFLDRSGDASLLMYPDSQESNEALKTFTGPYQGPKKAQLTLVAYAMGEPLYDAQVRPFPSGLARVRADLCGRGFRHADIHQAASLAAAMSGDAARETWEAKCGPCRIYALGSWDRKNGSEVVPVLYSPGMPDHRGWNDRHVQRWRVHYEPVEGHPTYRDATSWFLTWTPQSD